MHKEYERLDSTTVRYNVRCSEHTPSIAVFVTTSTGQKSVQLRELLPLLNEMFCV
jgi:hypothetical protein